MYKKILKHIGIIFLISFLCELIVLGYNFTINKVYNKFHLIGNESIETVKENMIFEEDGENCYIKIKNTENVKIYNVSLVLNQENQDVYLRILFNNDGRFIPKENKEASKFKIYFLSGMETNEFLVTYPKGTIDNGKIEKVVINDNIQYMPKIEFSLIQTSLIFIFIMVIYVIIMVHKYFPGENLKKEYIFLILASVIGLVLVFINVPQVRYDEHAHFWKSYEISEGHLKSDRENGLPSSVIDLFMREDGSYPNREFNYETVKEKMSVKLNQNERQDFAVGATAGLTPVSYIPQVIGTTIGRLLRLSPIAILWMGRITNLLAYIAIIFVAIKLIPSQKWKAILMIIALFPMNLNIASTLSPDMTIISVTILAISYTLYLKFQKEKIDLKNITILGILCVIPMICKVVYFPLCLLVLLLPKEKFEDKTKIKIAYCITIFMMIIPYIVCKKLFTATTGEIAIRTNTLEQCLFAISDLMRDIGTLINTMYSEFSNYFFEAIGGWNTIPVISVAIFIVLLLVMFLESNENDKYKFSKKDKIICSIIAGIEILGIMAGLYLTWTQAQVTVIEGVQGRYFLPVIPILALAFSNNIISYKIKNKEIKYMIFIILTFIIVCGFSIKAYI
ncbi:MAG: DUF2142 domain-containing protein [Clostridia bacterium]|nr:DUF2142 domain-containing protein [Clostridia bacterium]